jgi:sugar phosphate isomerase/epimerase
MSSTTLHQLAMKFAICNEIFRGWSLEDTLGYAKKVGYDAVEIAPFTIASRVTDISGSERQRIREAARRSGIGISGIHWVLAQTTGLHLTHPDQNVREETSRYFVDLVDFCADLGAEFIIVGSPKQRNVPDGVSKDQAWGWADAVFREPATHAAERAVTICLEPLAPTETNFINTASEAIRFVRQFNSAHFKIILDVKAMCSELRSIPEIIGDSWPEFAYFHANDRNLKGPGFGDVDFKPILSELKKVGYDGFVSVEVFNYDEGPEVIATRSLEYLKRNV